MLIDHGIRKGFIVDLAGIMPPRKDDELLRLSAKTVTGPCSSTRFSKSYMFIVLETH